MEKPKGFFHAGRRMTSPETDYHFATYETYLYAGRFGISANGFGILVFIVFALIGGWQVVLGAMAGWEKEAINWLPFHIVIGIAAAAVLVLIVYGIKYIASQIVVDGPGSE